MYFIFSIYILPLILVFVSIVFSKNMWKKILIFISIAYALLSIWTMYAYFWWFHFENSFIVIDQLNLIFVNIITILSSIIALYWSYYFDEEIKHHVIWESKAKHYLILSNLFIFAMIWSATLKNIIMIWVALEATTIFTTSLISFYGTKTSWEAAWKYLIICWIGLTIWLFWIFIIIYAGLDNADYNAIKLSSSMNLWLVKIGFIFTLIWIGTKIWLFPLNTWLPDAHGSWPTPISATMSSILLPLAILYLYKIKNIVDIMLGDPSFTNFLFIFMWLLTIVTAGFTLIKQKHLKRALAYSSSENMWIIVFALWLGPIGLKLWILHIIWHSFLKTASFMSAGNILIKMKSWLFENINNLFKRLKITSFLLIISLILLVGIPISPLFFTEILIIIEACKTNIFFALIFIWWLSLVFSWLLINFWNMFLDHELTQPSETKNIDEDNHLWIVHWSIIISIIFALCSNMLFFINKIF